MFRKEVLRRREKCAACATLIVITMALAGEIYGYSLSSEPPGLQPFDAMVMSQRRDYLRLHIQDSSEVAGIGTFLSTRQEPEGPTFSSGPGESEVFVSMINQEAQVELIFTFVPETNFTIDDYELVPSIGNKDVIDEPDVGLLVTEITSLGYLAYNVTVDIDFNKWTGITSFNLDALNKTTSTLVTSSLAATLTAVGITFFTTGSSEQVTIVGGPNYPLTLQVPDLVASPDVNLGVFIQYYDGSNSNDSLTIVPNELIVTTSELDGQLNFSSLCSAISGSYDGSDVTLTESCGLGFSTNNVGSEYLGPKFGFDFNTYQNGTFTTNFEWNQLVQGSDLELDGYSTYITVQISGELPPLVKFITPEGPFGVAGGDKVVINVENLPSSLAEAELWLYYLAIDFGTITGTDMRNATFDEGSIVVNSNRTISQTFTLPAGSGTRLPWVFTATKPTGETLTAVDQTSPTYLFSFEVKLVISEINPDSGPEAGGVSITLVGDFDGVDLGSLSILFDGSAIDSSLITSTSTTSITFTLPSRESIGTGYEPVITVAFGNEASNGVTFTYIPSLVLQSLSPSNGPEDGGTQVMLTGQFNDFGPAVQNSGIYFGNELVDSSLIVSYNSTVIVFNTPPTSFFQDSSVYSYNVSVQVNGDFTNGLLFSYEPNIEITSMLPNSGEEAGGTLVTLEGTFTNFDTSTSGLYFGGMEIDSYIASYNDSIIQFSTPSRSIIGQAYTYKVWISVGSASSNTVDFTYEDTNFAVSIDTSGGSLNSDSGDYELGLCSDSYYRAWISSGARTQGAVYKWTLSVSGEVVDILETQDPAIVSNSEVLYLPYEIFAQQEVQYNLTATITTSFSVASESIIILRRTAQGIGVRIHDPRARSPSNPNVTLTIPADIGIPGCRDSDFVIDSTSMTYEWTFRDQSYVFSYQNRTAPEEEISPTLLGREFHIPQLLMEYGTFTLSLTAYFTEQSEIRGSDSTIVSIEPAPLIAQVNAGQSSQLVSVAQSVTLSGAQSRDPDVLEGDSSTGLSFAWSCRHSWDSSLADAVTCSEQLLPSSSVNSVDFTISGDALRSVHNTSGNVFIEYSLQVSKTSQNATGYDILRESEAVTSTLILDQNEEYVYEELVEITVVNNQSAKMDPLNVKYYEDVIITPVSETTETTWTFELTSPPSQARTLLSSDENLLVLPGYYTTGSEAGRLSLGLKSNVLSPNTEYQFLISTFRANAEVSFEINQQILSLRTVEQPAVTVGNLPKREGGINDTFVLSAFTNYDGDFKFFFMVTDEFGFANCVGGCQGQNLVQFTLATAGEYSVRCDVYDSLGYTLLSSNTGENITVVDTAGSMDDLSFFSVTANESFVAGDHSEYQQYGIDMVKLIWSQGESLSPEVDSGILANFTKGMSQVAANAVPNSIQGAGYVRTAAALATLTPNMGITYTTETLYHLVNITVSALERTPDTGALQQIEDLLEFYNLTPELVLATYSTGSSRLRLRQEVYDPDREVRALWLDVYEIMQTQLAISVLKKCSCGCIEEVSTGINKQGDGISLSSPLMARNSGNVSAAASYVNPAQGQLSEVKIKLAHFCNSEQGMQLLLNEGNKDEARFSWCKGVFEESIKKLYFVFAMTPDYVYLSGLYRNVVLSPGLVSTMVTQIRGNVMEDAALAIDQCYNVHIPIPRNVTIDTGSFPSDQRPEGMRLSPRKEWSSNETSGLYLPDFSDIATETKDTEATQGSEFVAAELKLKTTGVLTVATRIAWEGAVLSLEGILLLVAQVVGVVLTVFVLVLVTTLGAWFAATRLSIIGDTLPPVEAADFSYVERDVYGRGTAIDTDTMMEEQEALAHIRRATQGV